MYIIENKNQKGICHITREEKELKALLKIINSGKWKKQTFTAKEEKIICQLKERIEKSNQERGKISIRAPTTTSVFGGGSQI